MNIQAFGILQLCSKAEQHKRKHYDLQKVTDKTTEWNVVEMRDFESLVSAISLLGEVLMPN